MSDLVERLRQLSAARWDKDAWERETTVRIPAEPERDIDLVLAKAADEIERLRAERSAMIDNVRFARERAEKAEAERDQLRALLAEARNQRTDARGFVGWFSLWTVRVNAALSGKEAGNV